MQKERQNWDNIWFDFLTYDFGVSMSAHPAIVLVNNYLRIVMISKEGKIDNVQGAVRIKIFNEIEFMISNYKNGKQVRTYTLYNLQYKRKSRDESHHIFYYPNIKDQKVLFSHYRQVATKNSSMLTRDCGWEFNYTKTNKST